MKQVYGDILLTGQAITGKVVLVYLPMWLKVTIETFIYNDIVEWYFKVKNRQPLLSAQTLKSDMICIITGPGLKVQKKEL